MKYKTKYLQETRTHNAGRLPNVLRKSNLYIFTACFQEPEKGNGNARYASATGVHNYVAGEVNGI